MNTFKSSAELKASAKERMFGHYGTAVGALLIIVCIVGPIMGLTNLLVDISTVAGTILYYSISFFIMLFAGLFTSGTTYLYLEIICGKPASAGDVFRGFSLCPNKAILIQGWITLISYLVDIPLIIISYRIINASESEVLTLMLPYALCTIFSYFIFIFSSMNKCSNFIKLVSCKYRRPEFEVYMSITLLLPLPLTFFFYVAES